MGRPDAEGDRGPDAAGQAKRVRRGTERGAAHVGQKRRRRKCLVDDASGTSGVLYGRVRNDGDGTVELFSVRWRETVDIRHARTQMEKRLCQVMQSLMQGKCC